MGEVYGAHDERLDRRVALKLLPATRGLDPRARRRLLREARAASALSHPGIVTVHEVGEDQGRAFIVMERVEGETLRAYLERRGRLAPAEALDLLAQIADAIHAIHEVGLVHRDLKPANLILDRRGRVKVLDFGLSKRIRSLTRARSIPGMATAAAAAGVAMPPRAVARTAAAIATTTAATGGAAVAAAAVLAASVSAAVSATGQTAPSDLTLAGRTDPGLAKVADHTVFAASALDRLSAGSDELETADGVVMGTPGYAAVELMAGGPARVESDVFSLAVIAYELITGLRPFEGVTLSALRASIERGDYTPASHAAPGAVGPRFDAALAAGLDRHAARRPPSAPALVTALGEALAGSQAPPRRPRRISARLTAVGLAAGLALGFAPPATRPASATVALGCGVISAPGTSSVGREEDAPRWRAPARATGVQRACGDTARPPTVEACKR
jgi:serine/threonine protein kinase